MPRLSQSAPPKYRKHKASGQAIVTIAGRDHYLGKHGTKASKVEYDRLIGEWLAAGRPTSTAAVNDITVTELAAAYWKHAEEYYRHPDGRPTHEVNNIRVAMRPLKRLYGHTAAVSFGPLALEALRGEMATLGWCRTNINRAVGRIKRVFKWGAAKEMIPAATFQALATIEGWRAGRCNAVESDPVKPVPQAYIEAALPYMTPQVAAMVQLQLLSGARPGEVLDMRTGDLDTSGAVWVYSPRTHKTQYRGHKRSIYLGPRAQAVIRPFLKTKLDDFIFSPREAREQHLAERRANRKTPMTPSQAKRRRKATPKRAAGDRYTIYSYRHAVAKACAKADRAEHQAHPGVPAEQTIIPTWHPHQLRHNAGTMVRKEYGLDAARAILGHRSPAITEVYAELDMEKAQAVIAKIG